MIYLSIVILVVTITISIYRLFFLKASAEDYYWIALVILAVWQMLAYINKKTMYAAAVPLKPGNKNQTARLIEFIIFLILWFVGLAVLLRLA